MKETDETQESAFCSECGDYLMFCIDCLVFFCVSCAECECE